MVAENFYFGDSRRDGDGGGSYGGSYGGQSYGAPAAQQPAPGYAAPTGEDQFTELVGDEDNLPF